MREFLPDAEVLTRAETERHLGQALRQGDRRALDFFLEMHWDAVVGYAERLCGNWDDAEDIGQLAFLSMWERRDRWDCEGSALPFLLRVTRNLSLNLKRRTEVRARKAASLFHHQNGLSPTAEEVWGEREVQAAAEAAINALPERRREVFILVRQNGLSHEEVAEIMGIAVQTVANQMTAAMMALRNHLAPYLDRDMAWRSR